MLGMLCAAAHLANGAASAICTLLRHMIPVVMMRMRSDCRKYLMMDSALSDAWSPWHLICARMRVPWRHCMLTRGHVKGRRRGDVGIKSDASSVHELDLSMPELSDIVEQLHREGGVKQCIGLRSRDFRNIVNVKTLRVVLCSCVRLCCETVIMAKFSEVRSFASCPLNTEFAQ